MIEVLQVASEAYPLIKTGGLADVVGALPAALAPEGVRMRTLLPGYTTIIAALAVADVNATALNDIPCGPARLLEAQIGGLDTIVLDAPGLYAREGGPYRDAAGQDWPDNPLRFASLAAAAARIASGALPGWQPHIVHAHDWQAGLAPAYLRWWGVPDTKTILTIHNLAFAGKFDASLLEVLWLPPDAMAIDRLEFYGAGSMLKAGLVTADRVTTVSPTYAAEILTSESGMGLDGVLRNRGADLSGILNGIDIAAWNPADDPHLAAPFSRAHLERRGANKTALQARFGLTQNPNAMLFGVVSRLSWQKGLDLLLEALPALLACGAQLAVLGAGETDLETGFAAAAADNPGRVACHIGYDEGLARQLQGGIDALLVPSRFEPCGLTQLCALRYGAIPVVARTGGLVDTVIDANPMAQQSGVATGIQFAPVTAAGLAGAIGRAATLYRDRRAWRRMQENAMASDVSWRAPARLYAALYRSLATS